MTRCFALLKMRLWRQAVFCVCPSLATVEKSHPQKGNEGGDKKTKTSKEVNKKRPPSIRSHFDRFATDDSVRAANKTELLSTFPFSCTPRYVNVAALLWKSGFFGKLNIGAIIHATCKIREPGCIFCFCPPLPLFLVEL